MLSVMATISARERDPREVHRGLLQRARLASRATRRDEPRVDAGEVGHLVAARRAGGDEHPRVSCARAAGSSLRSAIARDDVVVVARVAERSGHAAAAGIEIDRPLRQECATAAPLPEPPAPSIADGNAGGAGPSTGPGCSARVARPSAHSRSRNSSNSTAWLRDDAARARCSSPRSRSGASSRTADRQLGSTNTIALARLAAS